MDCPHCFFEFDPDKYEDGSTGFIVDDGDVEVMSFHYKCPNCDRPSIYYCIVDDSENDGTLFPIYPRPDSRKLCPPNAPQHISRDYYEASELIQRSPKSSAILSRRCLENILFDVTGQEVKNLSKAIDDIINGNFLPPNLKNQIEAIKLIGNLAAHGTGSANSEEKVSVSFKDANWSLNILSELLDYYYSQPLEIERRRDELNQKLNRSGKKLMK